MPRLKRGSLIAEKALHRMEGMRSLNDPLEFGNGLNLAGYEARIDTVQAQLSSYNTLLSTVDELAAQVTLLEQDLSTYSEKMLMGVATRYGKTSLQYMQAGGKRRKRSTHSTVTSTATTATAAIAPTPPPSAISNGNGATTVANQSFG